MALCLSPQCYTGANVKITVVCLVFSAALVLGCETTTPTKAKPAHPVADAESTSAIDAWSPDVPVDLADLTTRQYFVITESASVCPLASQALANECGNSVEFADVGYRRHRGETVTVVGEPEDGVIRAIRFSKAGTLPSWVDARSVGPTPDLAHLDTFLKAHPKAIQTTSDAIELMTQQSQHSTDPIPVEPPVFLLEIGGERIAVKTTQCLALASGDRRYMEYHGCLLYADCSDLDYHCKDDGYCDAVYLATKPAEAILHEGQSLRAFELTRLADRMGVFEHQSCQP